MGVVIVETPIFTRQVLALLSDDQYRRLRVIYYWAAAHQQLLMLLIYSKSERHDLRPEQLKALGRTVSEEFP